MPGPGENNYAYHKTGIRNLSEKCSINSRTSSQESFLKMSLYLELTVPIAWELFLNTVHTSVGCYAIKNDKYDTVRKYIERKVNYSLLLACDLSSPLQHDFRARLPIYTGSHQQQGKYYHQEQGQSSPP